MDDATNESSPQKPTALQRIWRVTKRVLPHSINIFFILYFICDGTGIYLGLIQSKGDAGQIGILLLYLVLALFFVITLLLGIYLKNKWAGRAFRYLSPLLFIVAILIPFYIIY